MATLDYDEIKPRKFILVDNVPFEILESHVARTQKRKPQNQVVTTPFFIEVGEKIVVNTETGEYVERLKSEK